jgi:hypothetical protein
MQSCGQTALLRVALFGGLFFHVETCYQSLSLILINKGWLDSGGVSRAGPGESVAVAIAPASHMASAD